MKQALFLVKSPPYGTLRVTEGYRAALGMAASGTPTRLVLLGDGVFACMRNQLAAEIDQTSVEELMESLVDFGVEVLVHAPSLTSRGLREEDLLRLDRVGDERLRQVVHEAGAVFVF